MRLHRSLTSHRKVPFRPVLTFVYPSKPTVGALLLPFSDSLIKGVLGNPHSYTRIPVRYRGVGGSTLDQRASEKSSSRKLGFRCKEFSETQSVPLLILGNPICRANPIRSGLGLCTNARTTFRCTGFSEIHALGWGCSQLGFFFPVAQAASCQRDNQQRQRPSGDRKVQIAAKHARSGEELDQGRAVKGVPGSVYQDGHEHAALRIVEDPHNDETKADESEGKHKEVEYGTPRRYVRKILGGDQKPRQVPEGPEAPQD